MLGNLLKQNRYSARVVLIKASPALNSRVPVSMVVCHHRQMSSSSPKPNSLDLPLEEDHAALLEKDEAFVKRLYEQSPAAVKVSSKFTLDDTAEDIEFDKALSNRISQDGK